MDMAKQNIKGKVELHSYEVYRKGKKVLNEEKKKRMGFENELVLNRFETFYCFLLLRRQFRHLLE